MENRTARLRRRQRRPPTVNTAMPPTFVQRARLPDFALWKKTDARRMPLGFDLELTARCNNDCRHCYINLPSADAAARRTELRLDEIEGIAAQAVELGALWCLLTGGEPLLRRDFAEIYLALKRRGLLVFLFTNACLVTDDLVTLLKRYPPRGVEVTVYGATRDTYERVTRRPGSFAAFRRGLARLLDSGIPVRLKAMAVRANVHELPAIMRFCRRHSCDLAYYDPLLHLRFDGDPVRNAEIRAERLTAREVAALEQSDSSRAREMAAHCDALIVPGHSHARCRHLFTCNVGQGSFVVGPTGVFRLCASLCHPDCVYDLRRGTLAEAWQRLVPAVLRTHAPRHSASAACRRCALGNLCHWCPAHAHLEHGHLDAPCEYFCDVAHARAAALRRKRNALSVVVQARSHGGQ